MTDIIKSLTEADEMTRKVIDTVLKNRKVGSIEDLMLLPTTVETLKKNSEELESKLKDAEDALSKASATSVPTLEVTVEHDGTIPEGGLKWVDVGTVFPVLKEHDFKVPFWEWDGIHPAVPKKDEDYIFRPELLLPALFALLNNERAWAQGHTGSGKTTLYEQMCAYLNYPFGRINLDSEISRQELIGKMDLKASSGATVTEWQDGLLPQLLEGPYLICLDEIDFTRPDVAYVMQSITEGGTLRILEDGGREVKPHIMSRIFATGNTNGQGDEHGIYQGARPQSAAFLNRFTTWIKVPYLEREQIKELIQKKVPLFTQSDVLSEYVVDHQRVFENGEVSTPISPRTYISVAQKALFYKGVGVERPLKKAIYDTIISSANVDDAACFEGIIDRYTTS